MTVSRATRTFVTSAVAVSTRYWAGVTPLSEIHRRHAEMVARVLAETAEQWGNAPYTIRVDVQYVPDGPDAQRIAVTAIAQSPLKEGTTVEIPTAVA